MAVAVALVGIGAATVGASSHDTDSPTVVGEALLKNLADVGFERDFRAIYGLQNDLSYLGDLSARAKTEPVVAAYDPYLVAETDGDSLVLAPGPMLMRAEEYEHVFASMRDREEINRVMAGLLESDGFSGAVIDQSEGTLLIRTIDDG